MHGYLLVKPRKHADSNADQRGNPSVIFLGDGLERIEGIHSDFLKNIGTYIHPRQVLDVFGEFTYAEVRYIRVKSKDLRIKVNIKHDPVDFQRMIKEPEEISLIGKSMKIVEQVFFQVKRRLRSGWPLLVPTEIELAEFIKQTGLKFGAQDISFPPIVASGPNAAIPHHVPSKKKLKPGESVILDFGFKYKNYCSDFTRTVFLKKAPAKLEAAYNQVEKAYWGCIDFMSLRASAFDPFDSTQSRPEQSRTAERSNLITRERLPRHSAALVARNDKGVTGDQVYQKAVAILAEKNLDKYFIHSLGHGTGLEIHELPNLSPKSKDIIKNGMVFSVEPGVYLPKIGGIRIEDLVYLEKGQIKKFINVSTKLKDNII